MAEDMAMNARKKTPKRCIYKGLSAHKQKPPDGAAFYDISPYGDAIYLLRKCDISASPMRYDINSCSRPARDISRRRHIASQRDISQIPSGIYIAAVYSAEYTATGAFFE